MSVIYLNKNLLQPCPLTTEMYGEFSYSNEQDQLLFDSISVNGILEPLVISEENVIISGYRRHFVAMMTTKIQELPVIVKKVTKINPLLIIQHNLQRKKNAALLSYEFEVIREALGSKQGSKLSVASKNELTEARKFVEDKVSASTRKRVNGSAKILMTLNPKMSKFDAYKEVSDRLDKGGSVNGILQKMEAEERKLNNQKRAKDYENFDEENFRIIVGDARTAHNQITDLSVQSLITSPPYFNMRKYSGRELEQGDFPLGEEPTSEMYVERQADVLANYLAKIKVGGSVFVNVMDTIVDGEVCMIPYELIMAMRRRGFAFIQDVIWFKENPPFSGNSNLFQPSREYILHFIRKGEKYYWDSDFLNDNNLSLMNDALYGGVDKRKHFRNTIILSPKRIEKRKDSNLESLEKYIGGLISTGVFNPKQVKELLKTKGIEHSHNAMFDFEVPMLCLLVSSKTGDLILDIYSGYASTGICAFALKRAYIGIEYSKEYADHSKARFKAMFEREEIQRSSSSKKTSTPAKKVVPKKTAAGRSKTK